MRSASAIRLRRAVDETNDCWQRPMRDSERTEWKTSDQCMVTQLLSDQEDCGGLSVRYFPMSGLVHVTVIFEIPQLTEKNSVTGVQSWIIARRFGFEKNDFPICNATHGCHL